MSKPIERLELTDEIRTGLPTIDAHHAEMFKRGNSILFPDDPKMETKTFRRALRFLSGYVYYHFAAEEFAMLQFRYGSLENHKHQHDLFRIEIGKLLLQAEAQGPGDQCRRKLFDLLGEWFTLHIQMWDKQLAQYLRAKVPHGAQPLPEAPALAAAGVVIEDFQEYL